MLTLSCAVLLGAVATASAQTIYASYGGYNAYNTTGCRYSMIYPYSGCTTVQQPTTVYSYYYTSGCYTYYYDGVTRNSVITGNSCQNQNTYQNTYSYVTPTTNTYYNNQQYYTSPYYTYGYASGSWYPGYNGSVLFGNYGSTYYNSNYNNTYNNGVVYTPTNPCYYINGYYTCQ